MKKRTPPRGYTAQALANRRSWLERSVGFTPPENSIDSGEDFQGLAENQTGYLSLPLSVAAPLVINGDYASGNFCVTLSTLEGTLVMSMTRGCLLTSRCGGIQTQHLRQEITRCPIFTFPDARHCRSFADWLTENFRRVKAAADLTTSHGKLLRVESRVIHDRVIAEFVFCMDNAAGQNMTTIATEHACRFIEQQVTERFPFRYLLECNYACDKNAGLRTATRGRGHAVIASCELSPKWLRRILRVTAEEMVSCFSEFQLGSQLAGVDRFSRQQAP